jgi:hypothetical protein
MRAILRSTGSLGYARILMCLPVTLGWDPGRLRPASRLSEARLCGRLSPLPCRTNCPWQERNSQFLRRARRRSRDDRRLGALRLRAGRARGRRLARCIPPDPWLARPAGGAARIRAGPTAFDRTQPATWLSTIVDRPNEPRGARHTPTRRQRGAAAGRHSNWPPPEARSFPSTDQTRTCPPMSPWAATGAMASTSSHSFSGARR